MIEMLYLAVVPLFLILIFKPNISLLVLFSIRKNLIKIKSVIFSNKQNENLNESPNQSSAKNQNLDKRDMIEEKNKTDFEIFFGSQTGTSESFAFELESEAKKLDYNVRVTDLSDFNPKEFKQSRFLVVLISTYGEGDPTESSEEFWAWLESLDQEDNTFNNTNFAVFGLGNRQYENFNAMGKKVYKKLSALNATPMCALGVGDDDDDIEKDFKEWKEIFWKSMKEKIPKSNQSGDTNLISTASRKYECLFVENDDKNKKKLSNDLNDFIPSNHDKKHTTCVVPVVKNHPISADGLKWHAEISIKNEPLLREYKAGQNLNISPRNSYKLVDTVCKRFGWNKTSLFVLKPREHEKWNPFSTPMSIETALLWYFDLTQHPRKSLVETLAHFMSNEQDKCTALEFKENTFFEIFINFKSIDLTFEDFVNIFPRLLVREYTVSSSEKLNPNTISITYSLVKTDPKTGDFGVCTNYLKCLKPGKDQISVFLKKSPLILPENKKSPVLMIAAGSGIAPFVGFVQEGNFYKEKGYDLTEWCLFFGCRNRDNDFLYKDFFESSYNEKTKCLSNLFVAFSRENKEKVYVQDLLIRESQLVSKILKNPLSHVYVCGSTAMGQSVKKALQSALQSSEQLFGENINRESASAWLHDMVKEKRFVCELWG